MTIKKQDNFFFYIPNQEGKHYMNAQKESLNNAADQFNTKARGFYLPCKLSKKCSLFSSLQALLSRLCFILDPMF